MVDASSLETFKVRLDQALGTLIQLWCPCLWQGSWIRWPSEVSPNSKDSMILWFYDLWDIPESAKRYLSSDILTHVLILSSKKTQLLCYPQ